MNRSVFLVAAALMALLLTGFGCPAQQPAEPPAEEEGAMEETGAEEDEHADDEGREDGEMEEAEKPDADGAALWTFLVSDDPYEQWELFPGTTEQYEGKEPHGALLTTYVNDEAKDSIDGKEGMMEDGSIIAKQNYTPDGTLDAITVMYKVEGYNADVGDWFWVKYKPGGEIEAEGKVDGCIGCHSDKKDNDYIWTADIK